MLWGGTGVPLLALGCPHFQDPPIHPPSSCLAWASPSAAVHTLHLALSVPMCPPLQESPVAPQGWRGGLVRVEEGAGRAVSIFFFLRCFFF